jgi:arginine repressor
MSTASPKKPAAVNKSAEIRKLAAAMKSKDQKPRPSLIMAELKKHGVVVSSPQVSMVLKKMGFRPLRKRKKAVVAKVGPTASVVSVEDLLAAKKVAGEFGGADKAIKALQALKRFEG